MGYGRCVGRVRALAVATRMTVSIGVAVLVVTATALPAPVSTASPAVKLSADSTALMLGGTSIPTWNDADVEVIMGQFIAPTHPGQTIKPVAVTTPEELWPGGRWVGPLVCLALCPTSVFGPGGSGWLPDEPLWKLSGLFARTFDQSVQDGVTDLEAAMAEHGNDHLVIYGYSQGAVVANVEKRKLAEQYPKGTTAPDIDFVLSGDPNLPNGGFLARFPGLYLPILNFSFNGPAPTDTQFDTVEITRQYDFMSDFPLYPLNGISLLNAVLGFVYVHTYPFDVSLAPDPTTPPPIHSKTGDTDYYFFETPDLPLFGPLRTLGVPESFIDVVEPFFRVLVELGYDRSIPPGEPTPARLIPPLNPATVAGDLVDAVGEGITNAAALIGAPVPLRMPAPLTADRNAAVEQGRSAPGTILAATQDDLQRQVGRELAATRDQINQTIGAVKSVIGDGRTIVRSARSDNGSPAATASPARKTPVRDAVKNASSDITKVVTKVSASIKQALSGGNDDDTGDGSEGGAR